jgi:protein-S-isoprenylcysteine O-methyltransferase Ste14
VATGAQIVRMSEEERMLRADRYYREYLSRVPRRLVPYVY